MIINTVEHCMLLERERGYMYLAAMSEGRLSCSTFTEASTTERQCTEVAGVARFIGVHTSQAEDVWSFVVQ